MGDNHDPAKAPPPFSIRPTREAVDALDALVAAAPGIARHRLAVAALEFGGRALAADPAALAALLTPAAVRALGATAVGSTTGVIRPRDARAEAVLPPSPAGVAVVAPAHDTDDAASSSPTSAQPRQRAPRGPRDEAPPEAVEAMRVALREAVERGASINSLATSAGMPSGGTRRRLAALLAGETPAVSAPLARAITAACEAHRRGG